MFSEVCVLRKVIMFAAAGIAALAVLIGAAAAGGSDEAEAYTGPPLGFYGAIIAGFFPVPTLVCHDTDAGPGVTLVAVTVSGLDYWEHVAHNMIEPGSQRADIYPPNRLDTNGNRWDAAGQAIHAANCV